MRGPWPDTVADVVRTHHTVTMSAQLVDTAWSSSSGPAGIDLRINGFTVDMDEQRVPAIRATVDCALPAEEDVKWISPLTGTLKAKVWAAYNDDNKHLFTLSVRRRAINRPANTMTLDLASADADWPNSQTSVVVS